MAKNTSIEACIDALRRAGGFHTKAAEMLGISQPALSMRIKRHKKLQEVVREIEEGYLDLAESKLLTKISKEDLGAICFYLKCKGKRRGYVERQEITGANGGPITNASVNINMSEEEAARIYTANLNE